MVKTPQEIQAWLDRHLLSVQKPGRYVGGELNQVVKDWDNTPVHAALVFPDIYDIGVPNLGVTILYQAINGRPDALAERAYIPWLDMEDLMRSDGVPLYSLESKHSLASFDMIGFSIPYETLYTNVLNAIDLAGVPLYSKDRDESHPLVIAGGHSTTNPEPISPFIDAFVIGEGEDVIHDIVTALQNWKSSRKPRAELLAQLAQIGGVYVPSLYDVQYRSDGTIGSIHPKTKETPKKVLRRIVPKLPPPPTRFIVPSIDVVHNRIAIEIMRGCTRGCRFCHAGMITRPVRERSVESILTAVDEAIKHTGYEEVALLSLSSSDYTHILDLVNQINARYADRHLTISLPSLRIDSFSVEIMETLKSYRQGGFTLAPEAATERMRSIINKPISTQMLIDTTREIYSRGWNTIKLYFMIGHPSETLEDVEAIADLCQAVMSEGRKVAGKRINLHVGVSTFVPKPHTPFEWVACDTPEQILAKQQILRREVRGPGMKLNWTDPKETMLEAWLSRGDRRLSEVVYAAWKKGAKFDAWQDQFQYEVWAEAFLETGLDPAFYSHRIRSDAEVFPWDHINTGVRKSYLLEEYHWSQEGKTRSDCRDQCYACGILPTFSDLRSAYPGSEWKCPEVAVKP